MSERMDITEVERLRELLEQAPECASRVSRAKAIRMLAPQFRKLRARGYTVKDIAGLLRGHGLVISVQSLRTYLGGKRIGAGPRRRARATAGAASATRRSNVGATRGAVPVPVPLPLTPKVTPPTGSVAAPPSPSAPPVSKPTPRDGVSARATFTPREDTDDL